jgi:hypothetical protein
MLKVLNDLHEVLERGTQIAKTYEQKHSFLNQVEETLGIRKLALDEREKELVAREAKCSKLEDADSTMKAATALMEDAKNKMDDVLTKEKDIRSRIDIENQLLNTKRIEVKKEADNIEVGRRGIEAEVKRRVDEIVAKMKKV